MTSGSHITSDLNLVTSIAYVFMLLWSVNAFLRWLEQTNKQQANYDPLTHGYVTRPLVKRSTVGIITEMLLKANPVRRPYSFVLATNNRWLFLRCIQCPMSSKRRTNTNDERHSVQQHFRYYVFHNALPSPHHLGCSYCRQLGNNLSVQGCR